MEEFLNLFLNTLQHDKGYAPNTVMAYRNDLTQFLDFAHNARPALTQWAHVDKLLLTSFATHLTERYYTPASIARKLAVLKSFFHFLVARQLLAADPTTDLGSPKVEKPTPQILNADEITRLLAAPSQNHTPKGLRDRAMLELLAANGLRVSELVALDVDDLNLPMLTMNCAGRGNRRRVLPLHPLTAETLTQYLERARPALTTDPAEHALFVNPRGARLTRQGLWLVIKEYVQEAGVAASITPHMLRHSFAVHLLNRGEKLERVQHWLGHASATTTQVYTRLADSLAHRAE